MRDRFFMAYETIKFKEYFYKAHKTRANKLYNLYTFSMISISLVSALAWSISKDMPALWAIVIAAAQFAQSISTFLPFSKQLTALKFLIPELSKMSVDLGRDWNLVDIDHYDDTKIAALISEYERKFDKLERRYVYAIDADFSESKWILNEAERMQKAYFYARYPETKSEKR